MHPVRHHVYHTDSHGDRVHFSTPQHQFSHGGESVQGSITIGSGGSTGAAAAGAVSWPPVEAAISAVGSTSLALQSIRKWLAVSNNKAESSSICVVSWCNWTSKFSRYHCVNDAKFVNAIGMRYAESSLQTKGGFVVGEAATSTFEHSGQGTQLSRILQDNFWQTATNCTSKAWREADQCVGSKRRQPRLAPQIVSDGFPWRNPAKIACQYWPRLQNSFLQNAQCRRSAWEDRDRRKAAESEVLMQNCKWTQGCHTQGGKRNQAVAVPVSKTSSGASWPQQCCEYGFLSCKQQDTKVEGCVIAVMWLHKVRKSVRFTRYQKKIPEKKGFFCMNDQGMLWTICQSDSHIASTSEERRRFQSFLLTRTPTQWPKSISNKDNRFGHVNVDWIHRKHSRWTGLYSKVDWCKTLKQSRVTRHHQNCRRYCHTDSSPRHADTSKRSLHCQEAMNASPSQAALSRSSCGKPSLMPRRRFNGVLQSLSNLKPSSWDSVFFLECGRLCSKARSWKWDK